jgi:FAD binding domain/Berberine and berberine like
MEALDRRDLVERAAKVAVAAGVAGAVPHWAFAAGPTKRQLRKLQREIRGTVVTPGEPGYARGRLLVNTRYDGIHPDAIVYCETTSDVQKTVRWARRHGIHIVPRSGRHSYAGYSTTGGVVVDVSRMHSVRGLPGKLASVGAGAKLIDVYSKLWNQHESIPAGSCPTVGVAGLALGGGIGFSSRKFGATCDAIKELVIVTADGRRLTCNAHEHADLFWACRGGGGGNFGIVPKFVFETHHVGSVSTFYIRWPWRDAARVVKAWQAFAPHAPRGLFSVCNLSSAAGGTPTISASGQFFGSTGALRRLLRPLLNAGAPSVVSIKRRSYMEAIMYWANCSSLAQCRVLPRETFKAKSDYCLHPLPKAGRKTLIRWVEARTRVRASGGIAAILDSYGGAINAVPKGATAFVHRNALFSIQYYGGWSGSASHANLNFIGRFYRAMRPFVSGFAYQNYIDPALRNWPHAYYGSNYPRLTAVKRKYDPHNVFHFRQSIRRHT